MKVEARFKDGEAFIDFVAENESEQKFLSLFSESSGETKVELDTEYGFSSGPKIRKLVVHVKKLKTEE